eukprot:TRINITY_DN42110_c0_g1_i1.p1 TRINITY_DN42110_c0_g1~~TRINITY_DN42110_c0_g1_i1.p1  ORF type:complete len:227 (+),score=57.41 TRINITY_DN42110_c0_g1_i1:28-681(+)
MLCVLVLCLLYACAHGCSSSLPDGFRESNLIWVGENQGMVGFVTSPESTKVILRCREWLGLDDTGECSAANVKDWLCNGTDCEPLVYHDADGDKTTSVYSADGTPKTWELFFDASSLPASCFPRRLHVKALFTTDDTNSKRNVLFPMMIVLVTVVVITAFALNYRRFMKNIAPRIMGPYQIQQDEKQERIVTRPSQTYISPSKAAPASPKGDYTYMV